MYSKLKVIMALVVFALIVMFFVSLSDVLTQTSPLTQAIEGAIDSSKVGGFR